MRGPAAALIIAFSILVPGCVDADPFEDADVVVGGTLDPQDGTEEIREYRFMPPPGARQVRIVGTGTFEGPCHYHLGSVTDSDPVVSMPEYESFNSGGGSGCMNDGPQTEHIYDLNGAETYFLRIGSASPAEFRYGLSWTP